MPEPRSSYHHPHHPAQHSYPSPHPQQQSWGHYPPRTHVPNGPPPPGMPSHGPDHNGPPPMSMTNGHSHAHHPPGPVSGSMSAAARAGKERQDNLLGQLAQANENTWMLIGAVAEQMQDQDRALVAFENALRHNPNSILGLNAVASIARSKDNFDKAIEYFQRILNIKQDNGEVWGSMGHCLLMKDDLPKAYTAYQQALYHLPNPKEPKLWYGIGILYDRYGSFEHAEEAFASVLKMDPNFEKANEIYFRLGIIYKHQRRYQHSLECFKYILSDPPRPLTSWDIWFQLGHVYEQDRDFENAREAYMRVLTHQPDHAKVLQQLGWLYHQPGARFADHEKAVSYLTKSLETDGTDAQSWYLLGRAFMAGQRYNKAYEAYQQAVYRDGRNPTFWCSIGVLYYQINQYRDALDAYSRAIRLNAFIPEVWYNLGSLYESCNNQITDAIDAYTRASELDTENPAIKQRLAVLNNANSSNQPIPPAPPPVDVHPSQYTAQPQGSYPGGSPNGTPHNGQIPPPLGGDGDGVNGARSLPRPPPGAEIGRHHSPGPFRGGGAPPPLQHVDESRGSMSRHAPLAPIEIGRTNGGDPYREGPPPQRYDPTSDMPSRRHADSPSSPRRHADAYNPYPYPPYGGPRDRERDAWERGQRMPPGPSPRMQDRAPGPTPGDIRRQPSPRMPPDYRGEYPPYPDARGPYGYDPRMDDRAREYTPSQNGLRQPSGGYEESRAHSPAPSQLSVGKKRKEQSSEPRSAKKERSVSKKSSGDRKTSLKLNAKSEGSGGEGDRSPKDAQSPSPSGPAPAASRTIDEDYDEGAADALMTLHGDRPVASPSTGTKRPASPSSPPANKKARPEAVPRLSASAIPAAKKTIIEVLNTPSINSPLPVAESTPVPETKHERQAEREQQVDVASQDKPVESETAKPIESVPTPAPEANGTNETSAAEEAALPAAPVPTEDAEPSAAAVVAEAPATSPQTQLNEPVAEVEAAVLDKDIEMEEAAPADPKRDEPVDKPPMPVDENKAHTPVEAEKSEQAVDAMSADTSEPKVNGGDEAESAPPVESAKVDDVPAVEAAGGGDSA